MKILMTGSHGFVGTNLMDALSGEHEMIRWDVRSDDPLPEVDIVIHLAGKAHDVKSDGRGQMEEYMKINFGLTQKIFDSFIAQSKCKKFIFFSSIKAKDHDTPYAKSKKAAEDYILSKFKEFNGSKVQIDGKLEPLKQSEKQVYILRPCMIHGKGVKGNLPLLFNWVKKGWPWPLAAFENQRSYASMGNVSFVVEKLIKKEVPSGIYNICDDEMVSTNELISLMSECMGQKPKMLRVPKGIVRLGAKMGDGLHLPLNTERLLKLTGDYVVDNSDIKHALGIHQMPVRATDGLKTTICSMIENQVSW